MHEASLVVMWSLDLVLVVQDLEKKQTELVLNMLDRLQAVDTVAIRTCDW